MGGPFSLLASVCKCQNSDRVTFDPCAWLEMNNQQALPFLDFASNAFSTRSPQVYSARDNGWCARTPYGLAVLRHREVGYLLRDRRLRQGSHAWPDTHNMQGSFAEFWKRSIISQDGEEHRALRNLAAPALTPEYIHSLVPAFNKIAKYLVAGVASQSSVEFMQDFAIPFAGQAICVLLGMPVGQSDRISADASDLGLAMGVECKLHEATVNAACDRLMDLADELVAKVRAGKDQNSYVARLVESYDTLGTFNHETLRHLIVISIFGGVDTTRSQLGLAVKLFIEHPDQWQVLRANPALVPQAIEEVIRQHPTTTWVTREATEDFEFEGIQIASGQTLHLLVHASATDPAVCPDAAFDVTAQRKVHFGFGGGAHNCLGQLVARTDMACALGAMAKGIAGFEYTGTPKWLPDSGNTSPVTLPIKCLPI